MAVTKTDAFFKQFGYWWFRVNKRLYGPIKEEKEARKAYTEKRKKVRNLTVVDDSWRP